ncbi:uncharacterized protein LOC131611639 [Vicia villosa]|uniref:uncharacterized protein LOC131611639 n=1 Tax=Vicia villosa TaxID=3911 RepID=UPI00273C4E7A|nr:uncharacterized protein LOC131611639 [Vicia villosa]
MDDLIDINMMLDGSLEEETTDRGNLEIGEMIDLDLPVTLPNDNTTQNTTTTQNTSTTQNTTTADDGATPLVDPYQSSQSHRNAFGKAPHPKKSAIHTEMVLIEMPDGTKKWKFKWCGKLYTYDVKWKSTSNGKKHLENCIQRKLRLKGNTDKHVAQSRC